MIGEREIEVAMAGMVKIAARGVEPDAYKRYIGIDPEGLRAFARDAADEEFGTYGGERGRLEAVGLSEEQEKAVRDALVETFSVAFVAAMTLIRAVEQS